MSDRQELDLRAGGRGHKSPGVNLEQMEALLRTQDTFVISPAPPSPHTALPSLSPVMDSDFFPQNLGCHLAPGRALGVGGVETSQRNRGCGQTPDSKKLSKCQERV